MEIYMFRNVTSGFGDVTERTLGWTSDKLNFGPANDTVP
jgi:hypothetical protein